MDDANLQRYREQLTSLRSRLQVDIGHVDQSRIESMTRPTELSDVPTHNANRDTEGLDVNLAVDATLRDELRAINDALERIVSGEFGECQRCGKQIAAERLDAIPYAAYCIGCEREMETEERT